MKFQCLILDHDDTAVDSTREIHYPAHLEVMQTLRPEQLAQPKNRCHWSESS